MNVYKHGLYSIKSDYQEEESIAIIPIKNFNLSEKYKVNKISIYPSKSIIEKELFECKVDLNFDLYEDFFDSTLIVFPIEISISGILGNFSLQEKNRILNSSLSKADDIMNVFKYIFCNLDKSSLLMQRAGYINNIYSGMLICYPNLGISNFLKEKYRINNEFIGKGLVVNVKETKSLLDKYMVILKDNCGETGNIVMHALRLYANIVESTNLTSKYTQSLSLIEYLTNPFEYERMQNLKGHILSFTVDNKKKYHELCERFKLLTGCKNDKGEEIGIRTNIVHNGKILEQLVDKLYEATLLIKELQTYICKYLEVCFENYESKWSSILTIRKNKVEKIMTQKEGSNGKVAADVLFLIDFKFFNKALQEIYNLYPNHLNRKFDMGKFLYSCMIQLGLERKNYKIPFQFIIESNECIYNDSESKHIKEYENLGFDSELGEFNIYVMQTKFNYYEELESFLYEYTLERNFVLTPSSQFGYIIFISDKNQISTQLFEEIEQSIKDLYLGRLDNNRTTSFPDFRWFDIQDVFCKVLGINPSEDVTGDFLFPIIN